jgi:tRNA A-37 threonylcarbamoyl transferase component Bud32
MTEKERKAKELKPPNTNEWNRQISKVRIFDNLIYNIDRNLGNLLITSDWKIYMIDHSRCFKSLDDVKAGKDLKIFSRSLMEAVQKLDEPTLTANCGKYLSAMEIQTMLKRRDLIVQIYNQQKLAQGASIEFP